MKKSTSITKRRNILPAQEPKEQKSSLICLFPDCRILPVDIYYHIFGYISANILTYVSVSKQWKEHVAKFIVAAKATTVIKALITPKNSGSILRFGLDWFNRHILKSLPSMTQLLELNITANVRPEVYSSITNLTRLTSFAARSIHHSDASHILQAFSRLKSFRALLTDDKDEQGSCDPTAERFQGKIRQFTGCDCLTKEKESYNADFFYALQHATRLENLDLSFRHLPVLPRYLSTLTRLTQLTLDCYYHLPQCFVLHFSTLTNLETISLPDKTLQHYSTVELEKFFAPFTKLRALTNFMTQVEVGHEDILKIDLFQRLTKIDKIDLGSTTGTPGALRHIKHLAICLESFHVPFVASLVTLEHLEISIDTPPAAALWHLTTLTKLKSLYFNNCERADWELIYGYASQMTNLAIVRVRPAHFAGKLPYAWQRVED